MKLTTILTILFIGFSSFGLQAQFGGYGGAKKKSIKGTISGSVVDTSNQERVAYATISLTKAGRKKIVDGVLSDDEGNFKFKGVVNGKYDLTISFLGYQERKMENIEVTLKKPTKKVGNIFLLPESYLLDAVEITEKRALIENKVDKIVFNAEDDSSIAGGDAADVLRKVPMLSVDLEGNVSMRGNQNVRILINGKPSGMFSSNVADALKMFPADQIKKVEVITSPGAKYDGEGSAGIINIITKKENIEGVAGTINASAGTRANNGNLNLNIGRGRFGFTTNGGLYYSLPNDANVNFKRTTPSGDVIYAWDGITNSSRLGFRGTASAFYDINAFNSLNTSLTLSGYGFDQDGTTSGQFGTVLFDRLNNSTNLRSGYDWASDYTKKFEGNDKQELSFAFQLSGNINNQNSQIDETSAVLKRNEIQDNDGDNLETTLQVDYTHPVGKSNKLEVGAKTVIRNIDSDSRFELFDASTNQYQFDPVRSNLFLYDQDVMAGYASYNFTYKKFNFVTGMRYERTAINGDGGDTDLLFDNSYENLLPNIAISRSLKNFRTIKVSYSKRIQRPSLFYINPFRNTADFANISIGEPTLLPELTDQYELSYNTNILGFTVFSSAYYKKTSDIIESIVGVPQEGISTTTFGNVGTNNSIGLNIFTSKSIGKVTFRGGGDIYSYDATGMVNGRELSNSALNYRLFTNGELTISSSIKADFFGFFTSPRVTLQGENPSFSIFGFGLKKTIKNGSIGIRIIEPFSDYKDFNSNIVGNGFIQQSSFSIPFRSFGLNLSYKFGKVDFKERKSKIKNSDMKAGEGGNDGGGNSGGPGGRGN